MKNINCLFISILCTFALVSCNDIEEAFMPQSYDIQGKVEKGPFISGSDISIQPMNGKLQVLGNIYSTYITDDLGNFILESKEFPTPYAEFISNGYFFNEVKGELSNSTLTLRALVDLRNGATTNINVITHLKYARIKNLVSQGKSFTEANSQAQKELLSEFGLGAFAVNDASSFSIIAGTDESAALIVVSSLLLTDRTEAALTEYLSKLSSDFGKNGKFSDDIKAQIKADKEKLSKLLSKIEQNIISRYKNLGIEISVKELSHFFDWNNDGIAGNEILKENQTVSLEKDSIIVPNEGGTYTIKINSLIPVYLEPQTKNDLDIYPENNVVPESFWSGNNSLYAGYDESFFEDQNIETQSNINDNTLEITVLPLKSKRDQTYTIPLYDYIGNIVASIVIAQKGKIHDIPVSQTPQLGTDAQRVVASAFIKIAQGLSNYNIIEQHYNYNKETNTLRAYITPNNSNISSAWAKLHEANNHLLMIKSADETRLNVFGDYINTLNALIYSNLVYAWGAVPYITGYNIANNTKTVSEAPQTIFNDLKDNLKKAIENLEEKKNESLFGEDFFFVSKDVARVLLANILMYENRYSEALPLLQQVIDNGFYTLDTSTDFRPTTTTENTSGCTEVIFALINEPQTRANIVIREPGIIPYTTLSDVHLSLAECHYKTGDTETARRYIANIAELKSITISDSNPINQIKEIREQILLHSGTYFAFLKRTGIAKEICNIEDYQLLFPIPGNELYYNPEMTQNPGYLRLNNTIEK